MQFAINELVTCYFLKEEVFSLIPMGSRTRTKKTIKSIENEIVERKKEEKL
jgi:hypothetical protein